MFDDLKTDVSRLKTHFDKIQQIKQTMKGQEKRQFSGFLSNCEKALLSIAEKIDKPTNGVTRWDNWCRYSDTSSQHRS